MSTTAHKFRRQFEDLRVEIWHETHDNLNRLCVWNISCNSDFETIIHAHTVAPLIEMFKGKGEGKGEGDIEDCDIEDCETMTRFFRQLGGLKVEIYLARDNLNRLCISNSSPHSIAVPIIPEHMIPTLIKLFEGKGQDTFTDVEALTDTEDIEALILERASYLYRLKRI